MSLKDDLFLRLKKLVTNSKPKILAKTKLAYLISKQEGYGIPGAIPTVRNNPGDLRHSPHSHHPSNDPNGIGYIDTVENGWADLERQLILFEEQTLEGLIKTWLGIPQSSSISSLNPDHNDGAAYLNFIVTGLNMSPSTPTKDALRVPYIPEIL